MLDSNHFWLLATALGSGVFWLMAYILISYRGFKDKSYGMPVVVVKVTQATQDGDVILSATAEVELPF